MPTKVNKLEHGEKIGHILVAMGGAGMVWILGNLSIHHDAAVEYRQHVDPHMAQLVRDTPAPDRSADQAKMLQLLRTELSKETFEGNTDLIDRVLAGGTAVPGEAERINLASDLFMSRRKMEGSQLPGNAQILALSAAVLMSIGLFLVRERKSKPEIPDPPPQPWNSVPPPALNPSGQTPDRSMPI